MSGTFEQAFRAQLSSWRGSTSAPEQITTNSHPSFFDRVQKLNPFKSQSYVSLPISEPSSSNNTTTNESIEEPSWFTLSRWDRLLIFGITLLGAVACFALCFAILPLLAMKPRKFAVLWSLGSLLFVISFGVLQGPLNYLVHLTSPARLPFTVAYFSAIIMTLVFSIGLKSTLLTILAAVLQVIAAIWYTVSYFPMGSQSLKFASRVGARQVTNWINS